MMMNKVLRKIKTFWFRQLVFWVFIHFKVLHVDGLWTEEDVCVVSCVSPPASQPAFILCLI